MKKKIFLRCPNCQHRIADHVCFASARVEIVESIESPQFGIRVKCTVCKSLIDILLDNCKEYTRIQLSKLQEPE